MPESTLQINTDISANTVGGIPKMNKDEAAKIIAAMNVEKIISNASPKIEEAQMESMANERATREPLPGAYNNAFTTEPLTVKTSIGDVVIRPMVSYDINIIGNHWTYHYIADTCLYSQWFCCKSIIVCTRQWFPCSTFICHTFHLCFFNLR